MKIPFTSFEKRNSYIKDEIIREFTTFFDSKWYVLGDYTNNFERNYSTFNKVDHTIGVGSGLDALHLCLRALDIKSGDEVVVPSNTYIASVLAITHCGAKPVFVEPNIETYNIDVRKIEKAITKKTKAILPVHLYGQACEMSDIMSIANEHNLFVIEDNAQAHGAEYDNKLTGSFGDANAVSFYPTKNLGAIGEAGAVTTNDEYIDAKVRMLRNYGSKRRYENEIIGYNNRIDEFEALFLSTALGYLDTWNNERIKTAQIYIGELSLIDELILPTLASKSSHVYHLFVIRTNSRDELQKYLKLNGVDTIIHYPIPPHLQKCYDFLGFTKGSFPIAEEIAETILSLPNFIGITEKQILYVCQLIKSFYLK